MSKIRKRCFWCGDDPLYKAYHDNEWGMRVHDDCTLFEQLILEGAQAGLSWLTILKKRPHYRKAFAQFVPQKVARFKPEKIDELLKNTGLVRHRGKIESAVRNAQVFIVIQKEFGSFRRWLDTQIKNIDDRRSSLNLPSVLSKKVSRDLKRRGMKFVGPTIIHAYLQAIGVYQDHLPECWKFRQKKLSSRSPR
ncbi:MAG: DNA-3-methyladenine glycosylase I [Verrucomicrobia bacterium]|nr:DNA-3-methyladenine glycosylase I [Verrucomicrobiota bacterium]